MGILNHLFSSIETRTKEAKADDEAIIMHWKQYAETVPKKKTLITELGVDIITVLGADGDFKNKLSELKKLLELELVDISDGEKEEVELIKDLEAVEHDKKIKRIQELDKCLGYAATKYEHVHGLLKHLHSILKNQIHLVVKLQKDSQNTVKLIIHLKAQLELELTVLKQVGEIPTFQKLFVDLIKGEHIIKQMDDNEKKLLKRIEKGIKKRLFSQIKSGLVYELAGTLVQSLERKFEELIAAGVLEGWHENVDFEFVNLPEFIDFVKESLQTFTKTKTDEFMRELKVSEDDFIKVFVPMFRDWYNHDKG